MTVSDDAVLGARYHLGRLIARGGMAEVYEATDQMLGRRVAVKLLREVTDDPADRARFTAEARTLAKLNHPSVVTVLDAGTDADRPFLVLELVEGYSLAEVLPEPLPPAQVARLGAHVAAALAHAHAAGIVHRDVKPGNVLLGRDGLARLTDFGIARLLADTVRHTKTGFTIGTAAYLSPEQVRGEPVTPAADVYSLGLVLIEALTGQRVFTGSLTEAAMARLHGPPPIPGQLPAGWRELLAAMTRLQPTERPTAERVAATLEHLSADPQRGEPVTAAQPIPTRLLTGPAPTTGAATRPTSVPAGEEPATPVSGRFQTARSGWRPHRAWTVAAALVAAVSLILVAVWLGSIRGGEPAGTDGTDGVPPQVPSRLQKPLAELRDAIHGESR